MDKKELRTQAKRFRKSVSYGDACKNSRAIADRLFDNRFYQNADQVFCYASARDEVPTGLIMERVLENGKKLCVPFVTGKEMEFLRIEHTGELKPGTFGIPEPAFSKEKVTTPGEHDIILVPGLAFDPAGNRIGYGGGYYDRYFAAHEKGTRIGLLYEGQLSAEIDAEPCDQKMDLLITEKAVYVCGRRQEEPKETLPESAFPYF